jgi:type I restriction enzyme S subunit
MASEFKVDDPGWSTAPLGRIADFINGRAFKPSDWSRSGAPIIRIQNLNGGADYNHFEGDFEARFEVRPGDLLFSWSGTRGTSFGPHLWRGVAGVLNQHIFNVRNLRGIDQAFLFYALKSITRRIEGRAHGGTGIVHITKGQLEAFEVPLPPLPEQRKIATILAAVDDVIENTEAVIENLQALKRAMMQELLTRGLPGRHTRFKLTAVGEVPHDWQVVSLAALATKITDGEHQTPRRQPSGVLLLSARNVQDGFLDLSTVDHVGEEEYARIARRCLPEHDDLLISCSGTIGRVCRVPQGLRFVLVRSVALVKPRHDLVSPVFLEQVLRGPKLQEQMNMVKRQAAQANLFQGPIRQLQVVLPTLVEQAAIGTHLSQIDARIDAESKYCACLREVKAAVMSALLTGELRVNLDEGSVA